MGGKKKNAESVLLVNGDVTHGYPAAQAVRDTQLEEWEEVLAPPSPPPDSRGCRRNPTSSSILITGLHARAENNGTRVFTSCSRGLCCCCFFCF